MCFQYILVKIHITIILYNRTKVFKNNKLNNINYTMYLAIEFDKRLFLPWLTLKPRKRIQKKNKLHRKSYRYYVVIDRFHFRKQLLIEYSFSAF